LTISLAEEVGRLRQETVKELRQTGDPEKAADNLAQKFSVEPKVLRDVISEVNEQLKRGLPVPTHELVLVEGFDKYLIVHACFGETVNKTLGCIFDAVLSGHELIAGWWNDGYRILIEMPRKVETHDLERLPSMLFGLTTEEVDKAFETYLEARFPFAYKLKFVAERFGALPRGRTMSYERLAMLPERFKNTPIYEETLREAMLEKVDLSSVKKIMASIKYGGIRVETLLCREHPSPMAYHVLAKYSDVPELMTPEHVLLSNIEKMKKSIEARKIRLLCFSCGDWSYETVVRGLPEKPVCAKCGSGLLASLKGRQDLENLRAILRRRLDGNQLSGEELNELTSARRVADLVLSYGKKAVVSMQVRGIGPETASRILGKMHVDEDEFYMDLLKAKIQFLKTRQYWDDKDSRV